MSKKEDLDKLEKAIDELKSDYREVIVLSKIDGLSYKEIGDRLGKSIDSVGHLLSRAMVALTEARTDIWSFGCVMYEMLTGYRPFEGKTISDTVARTLEREPDWQALPQETPANIRILLRHCLEKDMRRRLQHIGDAAIEIRETLNLLAARLTAPVRTLWRESANGGPGGAGPGRIKSLAVLPLKNLTGDPEQEYFADGMTEALITNLGKIGALQVRSRTSIMQYKGVKKTLPEIARELNVDAVVEGSVLRVAEQVRITAQLIHAPTDTHLWAESYERDLRDVLALQSEVARAHCPPNRDYSNTRPGSATGGKAPGQPRYV